MLEREDELSAPKDISWAEGDVKDGEGDVEEGRDIAQQAPKYSKYIFVVTLLYFVCKLKAKWLLFAIRCQFNFQMNQKFFLKKKRQRRKKCPS